MGAFEEKGKKLKQAINTKNNVVIEVYRGCVSEVYNIPKGYTYQIFDWDVEEA